MTRTKRNASRVIYQTGADAALGYSGNGESQHTRRATRGEVHRAEVSADTTADLLKRLQRAKARHGNHHNPVVRRRAGEDMRELQGMLRRLGYAV